MREILFRGKPLGDLHGKFIYGSLGVLNTDLCAIYHCFEFKDDEMELVYINTVGQYTGLTDKNGKKIFEGDILHCTARLDSANMVVIYEGAEFRLVCCERYKTYTTGMGYRYFGNLTTEVIGNIYDNPELLEVEEKG
jgi:uncharacterized phage protein (TIGR01671 family)